MTIWESYIASVTRHTVVGDLRVQRGVHSPQLNNARDVLVWLPPSYNESSRHYTVLYMHDAQNLFDEHTSYVGEWRVDETMHALSAEGLEAIVVGLPNMQEMRRVEYNPYPPGRGDDYMRFIVETVKPLIDRDFRTLPDAQHTGLAGSSMGGLISLYGMLKFPQVFGFCGAFSPAFWFGANGLMQTVSQLADGSGKIYLDVGTKEGHIFPGMAADIRPQADDYDLMYVDGVRDLRRRLLERGCVEGANLMYVEEADAPHNESAWSRRLPAALRFLLPRVG